MKPASVSTYGARAAERPAFPPDLAIRPARRADLDAVRPLLAAGDLTFEGVEAFFGEAYAVAEQACEVVGTAGVEVYGRFGLLRSVAVAPALRGRGVGEALVLDRLRWAEGRGLLAVYLLTTAAPDWYPRFGFVPVERGAVPPEVQASLEWRVCPACSVVMECALVTGRSRTPTCR